MKSKNTLLLNTVGQFRLLPSIGRRFLLLSLGIALITGCELDRDRDAEPPTIGKLTFASPMDIQESINVTAVVLLNENKNSDLQYEWSVTGGQIANNGVWDTDSLPKMANDSEDKTHGAKEGSSPSNDSEDKTHGRKQRRSPSSVTAMATYIAPETAGFYTITLKVCTRYAVVEEARNVEVTDFIIESEPLVHWRADGGEQIFTWRFNVAAIRRDPISLRYEIQQDIGLPEATLNIKIDEEQLPPKTIEKPTLATQGLVIKDVDITKYITSPKKYKLTLTLTPTENIKENKWLLKKIQVTGVEGAFLP